MKQIEYLRSNVAEYNRVARIVRGLSFLSVKEMADRYAKVYDLYGRKGETRSRLGI